MTIPLEYLFGVDVAIKKLRPHANFEIAGTNFTKWDDPTGTEPPLWTEVSEQIEKDKEQYEKYQRGEL